MLVIVRSVVFNVLFYLNLLVHFFVAMPTLVHAAPGHPQGGELLGPHQLWCCCV